MYIYIYIYIILCYYYNTKVRAKQPKMCINCFISESACRIPFYQRCHLLGNQTVCLHQRKSTRFWCDLVLPTGYIIAYYASGGRAVERRTVKGTVVQSHLPPLQNLGNFFTPHLPVSFGRDTKSRWSLLSGVYARGSKRSPTGGKCVTCSGLTNSREGQLLR